MDRSREQTASEWIRNELVASGLHRCVFATPARLLPESAFQFIRTALYEILIMYSEGVVVQSSRGQLQEILVPITIH